MVRQSVTGSFSPLSAWEQDNILLMPPPQDMATRTLGRSNSLHTINKAGDSLLPGHKTRLGAVVLHNCHQKIGPPTSGPPGLNTSTKFVCLGPKISEKIGSPLKYLVPPFTNTFRKNCNMQEWVVHNNTC